MQRLYKSPKLIYTCNILQLESSWMLYRTCQIHSEMNLEEDINSNNSRLALSDLRDSGLALSDLKPCLKVAVIKYMAVDLAC